eukprot:2068277-Prymnesium_polylepis.1
MASGVTAWCPWCEGTVPAAWWHGGGGVRARRQWGEAWRGRVARRGTAGRGMAHGMAWRGVAWRGRYMAWRGVAWCGMA